MRLWKYAGPALATAAIGGAALAAYATRDKWTPHVFPAKSAAKSGDGHAGHEDHDGHDHGAGGDRVKLSPQAQANLGLDQEGAVDTLVPQEYWRKVAVPGVVVDRPGVSDRGVASRTAGIVTEIKARPGDTVKAGDPLFTLQLAGEFVQSAQTDLAKTAKDLAAAVVRRDLTKKLVTAGTQSGVVLIEDENAVTRLTTQVNGFRRQLAVLGLTPDQIAQAERGDAITQVTVTAPPAAAAGGGLPSPTPDTLYEVQELQVQLGTLVQAGQALCTLANHQRLFVEAAAFASEAKAVAVAADQKVGIAVEFPGENPGDWPAVPPLVVDHVGPPGQTGGNTFPVYLPLENEAKTFERGGKTKYVWRFRPGQRARLLFPVEKLGDNVFVLPAGAVVREGPEAFVFVQSGDVFRRKPVRVLYEDPTEVVVAKDGSVSAAEFVVRTPAAAALNRAVKAAASAGGGGGDHHGHSHD